MIRNTPRGTPARVLILFGLLASVVMISALRDFHRRDGERITYPTAVGDIEFFKPAGEPVRVAVHGRNYSLHEEPGEHFQRRDDQMYRVPLAVPVPRLYTTSESFPDDQIPPLFLKAAHGEYVRVELRREPDHSP